MLEELRKAMQTQATVSYHIKKYEVAIEEIKKRSAPESFYDRTLWDFLSRTILKRDGELHFSQNDGKRVFMIKNIMVNLILSFFTGIFAVYLLARKIDINSIIVCVISVGVIALGYLIVGLIKKVKRTSE